MVTITEAAAHRRPPWLSWILGRNRGSRVDAYIDALPDWQQAICRPVGGEGPCLGGEGPCQRLPLWRERPHGHVQNIIANSRTGGWRKSKRESWSRSLSCGRPAEGSPCGPGSQLAAMRAGRSAMSAKTTSAWW